MASTEDVAQLRRYTGITDTTSPYSNVELGLRIDAAGSVRAAAADIWRELAVGYASLVDTTEGSSSRKLSQLRQNALDMAAEYDKDPTGDLESRPRSRAIVRG